MSSKKKNAKQAEKEIDRTEEIRNNPEPMESSGYVASAESNDYSLDNAMESETEIDDQCEKVDTATQVGSDVDTARDFLPPELTLAPMDFVLNSARGEAQSFVLLQVKREKSNDGKTQKERIFFRMEADINPKWMIAQEKQQRKIAETKKSVVYKSRPRQKIPRPKPHPKPLPKTVKKIDEIKQKISSKNINEKLSNKKGKIVKLPSKDKAPKGVLKKTGKSVASAKTGKSVASAKTGKSVTSAKTGKSVTSAKAGKKEKITKVKTPVKGKPPGRSTVKTGTKGDTKRAVTITGKKTATIPKIQKSKKATLSNKTASKPVGKQVADTKTKNTANKPSKTPVKKVTTKVQSSSGRQQSKPTTTNKKTARAPVASNTKGAPTAAPSKAKATTSKTQGNQKSVKPAPSSQRAVIIAPKNEEKKSTKAEATPKPAEMRTKPIKSKVPVKPALIQKPEPKKIPKQPAPKSKLEDIKQEKKQQENKKDEKVDEPKIIEIPLTAEVQHLNEGPVPSEDEPKINSEDPVDVTEIEEEIIEPEVVAQPETESEEQVDENKIEEEIIVSEVQPVEEVPAPLEIESPVVEPEVIPIPEKPEVESITEVTIEEPLLQPPHMCYDCGYIVQEHFEVKDEGEVGSETPEGAEKPQEPELCQKCCKNVIKTTPDPNECINCLGYLGNDTQFELKFDPSIRNLVAICSICKGPLKIDQKVRNKPPVVLRETRGTLSAAFAEMVRRLERIALESDDSPLGAAYVTSYHDDYQPYELNVRPRPRLGLNIPTRPRFTHTSAYSQEFKQLPFIKPESFFGRRKFSGLGQVRI